MPARIMTAVLAASLLVIVAPLAAQNETGGTAAATHPDTVDLRVDDQPLLVLLERIARQCQLGLVVETGLDHIVGSSTTIYAKDAPWDDAMRLLREQYEIEVTPGAKRIVVTSAHSAFEKRLRRGYYPVETITRPVNSFRGPTLGLAEQEYYGGGSILDIVDDESLIEDLPKLVSYGVGSPDDWDRDGVMLDHKSDVLVVRQVPEIHEGVRELITRLEKNAARQVVCRVYPLEARELPTAVVDVEELETLTDGRRAIAAFVIADGQTNHHYIGTQVPVTTDAESVSGVVDPVVSTLREGFSITVAPHVTRDGILASMRVETARATGKRPYHVSDLDGVPYVVVQRSEIDRKHAYDTRLVPFGGAAVLTLGDDVYGVSFEVAE